MSKVAKVTHRLKNLSNFVSKNASALKLSPYSQLCNILAIYSSVTISLRFSLCVVFSQYVFLLQFIAQFNKPSLFCLFLQSFDHISVLFLQQKLSLLTVIDKIYFQSCFGQDMALYKKSYHYQQQHVHSFFLMCSTLDSQVKYISYTVVQSFSQVDPFLLLVLFENLYISGHFFIITVLVFHYIGKKLPYFSYFEQKSQKIAIL